MKKLYIGFYLMVALLMVMPCIAQADYLETISVSITGTGGAGGAGTTASDMVFETYGPDGWGWAGGAGGVQGDQAITNTGGYSIAANEVFRFNVGSIVDGLDSNYGAGNWTVDNLSLSFNSSYNQQNNSRFGRGSGDFDIYWVANDNWAQSRGTVDDRQLNPIYAGDAASLLSWSGSQALLNSEYFDCSGTGYVHLSYSLDEASLFVDDILFASASSNPDLTLYLMGMSDTLGMIIFTGGQGQTLPTLTFDVVDTAAVPIPGAVWLLGSGILGLVGMRKKSALGKNVG